MDRAEDISDGICYLRLSTPAIWSFHTQEALWLNRLNMKSKNRGRLLHRQACILAIPSSAPVHDKNLYHDYFDLHFAFRQRVTSSRAPCQ